MRAGAISLLVLMAGVTLAAVGPNASQSQTPARTVYVAPAGDDANPGTRDKPVLTFDRAYRVARPGDTVEIAAGIYTGQRIALDPTKVSMRDVLFRPAPGEQVLIDGNLAVSGKHITFRDLTFTGQDDTTKDEQRRWIAQDGAEDLTFRNIDATGFHIAAADRIKVIGGDYGPCNSDRLLNCLNKIQGTNRGNGRPATDVLIDGAVFHDYSTTNAALYHQECLFLVSVNRLTIRNSRFFRCAFFDIFIQDYANNGGVSNVLIENNWFAAPTPPGGGAVSTCTLDRLTNITIRFNSFTDYICAGSNRPQTWIGKNEIYGNIIWVRSTANCPRGPNLRVHANVWVDDSPPFGTTCGASGRTLASFPYVRPTVDASLDYHLASTDSRPNNFVPDRAASGCPRSDIDGDLRPRARKCDAGADERGSAILCHRTKSKRKPFVTLIVREPDVERHFRHGDRLGACKLPSTRKGG